MANEVPVSTSLLENQKPWLDQGFQLA